ncbi:MAG TPA: hypothetical protein GX694_04515 [Actinomycetales bacterium]|nr:hypothetical protein [Actinomycetales bacterium]
MTGLLMVIGSFLTWWTVKGELLGIVFDYSVPGVGSPDGEVWEGLENVGPLGMIVLISGVIIALLGLLRALGKGGRLIGVLVLLGSLPPLLLILMHYASNDGVYSGIEITAASGLWIALLGSFATFLVSIWAIIKR